MENEKRNDDRFEPSSTYVSLKNNKKCKLQGYVLDISSRGIAVDLPKNANIPTVGSEVEIKVKKNTNASDWMDLGTATISRFWNESAFYDDGKGIALSFSRNLDDQYLNDLRCNSTQQENRYAAQAILAKQDINHLSAFRRTLSECQMRLYINTITFSVSLAAAYFALSYYGIVTDKINDAEMSFWRTLLAAMPGLIAIVFAVIVSQKNAYIQRVDAYLAVIKEYIVKNKFPREYRGWETESRKFRNNLKSTNCSRCEIERKCGTFKDIDNKELKSRKFLRNPFIDFYYMVMYLTFLFILLASIIAIIIELTKFQHGKGVYMAIGSIITFVMGLSIIGIIYLTYQLRKGRYSSKYYIRCWIDLFNKCSQSVIS